MTEKTVSFHSGNLALEGVYTAPQGEGPFPAVVVCHPHPLYGGMMDNNVVLAVCHALSRVAIASLRFNFRGVGGSEGAHDGGIGERDDVAAAIGFVTSAAGIEADRIGLCGYSFGAVVALEAAARTAQVRALTLISPILSPGSPLEGYEKPKLLIWGSRDLALPAGLDSLMAKVAGPKQYEAVTGADHFWWGYEDRIGSAAADFFSSEL